MDKRTGIAAGAIAAAGLAAGVEAMRRKGAHNQQTAPAVPGVRAEVAVGSQRAHYSPGPRANPESENGAVRRAQDSLERVLGH
jgi:hypothetical protein